MLHRPLQELWRWAITRSHERFPKSTVYCKYWFYKYFTLGRYSTAIVGIRKVKKYVRTTSVVDFKKRYGYYPSKTNLLRDHELYSELGVSTVEMIKVRGCEKRPVFYFEKTADLDKEFIEERYEDLVDTAACLVKNGYHFDIMPKNFGQKNGDIYYRDTFGFRNYDDLEKEITTMTNSLVTYYRLVFDPPRKVKEDFRERVRDYVNKKMHSED